MWLSTVFRRALAGRLRLTLSFSIALISISPRVALAQDIGEMCYVQQFIQSASLSEFTDPHFAHPVSDGITECQAKNSGTNAAEFECTSLFHDAPTALAFAIEKEFIFRHCFPGLQFQDDGQTTDSRTGQQFHDVESSTLSDQSWINVKYETTPDAKRVYHVQYVVHSPP